MIWSEILLSLVIALVVSLVTVGMLGWRHPNRLDIWPAGVFMFFIVALAAWAGGNWTWRLLPGSGTAGLVWLPYVLMGVFAAVVVMVLVPKKRTRASDHTTGEKEEVPATNIVFGLVFWLMIAIFVAVLMIGYMVDATTM